jgi:uncharacterized MAPEG superfamily protein
MLGFSCVLGIVQILLASHSASFQRGYRWTASSREGLVPPLTGIANCFDRALRNFLETFPIFAAIVLATELTGRQGPITFWGVHLYFWARLAYVPLYGVPVVRSVFWNIATSGILMLLAALLVYDG